MDERLEALRAQCRTHGLRTVGSLEVLTERFDNYQEKQELLSRLTFAMGDRKRKRPDLLNRHILDADLRKAAKSGTLEEVQNLLYKGADMNAVCTRHGKSPLIKACTRQDDYDTAKAIVCLLLEEGASVLQPDRHNASPLHWACGVSSAAIVGTLLEADARLEAMNKDDETPYFWAVRRDDDEAVRVVAVLHMYGADYYLKSREDKFPLFEAAEYGRSDVVAMMLGRSSIEMNDLSTGPTALIAAASNIMHGAAMVPLILEKRVPHNSGYMREVDSAGRDAMMNACLVGNTAMIKALKKYAPPQPHGPVPTEGTRFKFLYDVGDPLGVLDESGLKLDPEDFHHYSPAPMVWPYLRRTLCDVSQVWKQMKRCTDFTVWHWVGLEMLNVRHPEKGTTLLHVAAANGINVGMKALMNLWANPFIRDTAGRTPSSCVQLGDNGVRFKMMHDYAQQRCIRREVIRWYGPCFLSRAHAWMLCVMHWRLQHVRFIPKEVALLVLQHVMATEYV
jgi:ankyrin repeat protein